MRRGPLLALLLAGCFVQEPLVLSDPKPPSGAGGSGPREVCGNGIDDDGDGFADEGCPATGEEQACYTGPLATRGVGSCRDGKQTREGSVWGPCVGDVTPQAESCADATDSDCDGTGGPGQPDDAGCSTCTPQEEVCNGRDDDCDTLVDEGVTNACGLCPGEICYRTEVSDPADCTVTGRTCANVAAAAGRAITLGEEHFPAPDLVLGLEGRGSLVAVDPATLEVRWEVPGPEAARVASTFDGAWVLADELLTRLSPGGEVACVSSLPAPGRALVADARGRALAATDSEVLAFDPEVISGDPPLCGTIDLRPADHERDGVGLSAPAGSLAVGPSGLLWSGADPADRIDLHQLDVTQVEHESAGKVVLDGAGDPWFAGEHLHRVGGLPPHAEDVTSLSGRGVAWAPPFVLTLGEDALLRVSPGDLAASSVPYPEGVAAPRGLTASGAAAFFTDGERLVRHDGSGWTVVTPVPGAALHLVQDAARGGVTRRALWSQIVDGEHASMQWIRLEWTADVPPGTAVEARVAFAHGADRLAGAPRCGPMRTSPAELGHCPGASFSRMALVELLLVSSGVEAPLVRGIAISSTRP